MRSSNIGTFKEEAYQISQFQLKWIPLFIECHNLPFNAVLVQQNTALNKQAKKQNHAIN